MAEPRPSTASGIRDYRNNLMHGRTMPGIGIAGFICVPIIGREFRYLDWRLVTGRSCCGLADAGLCRAGHDSNRCLEPDTCLHPIEVDDRTLTECLIQIRAESFTKRCSESRKAILYVHSSSTYTSPRLFSREIVWVIFHSASNTCISVGEYPAVCRA